MVPAGLEKRLAISYICENGYLAFGRAINNSLGRAQMLKRYGIWTVVVVLLSGCATTAPPYQPSMENVGTLQNHRPAQVKVGGFTAGKKEGEKVNQLTIRGGAFASPYGGSYVEYLREALREELRLAGLLNDKSEIEVSGALLRNEFDASGVTLGHATMEAELTVKKNGAVRYRKTKSMRHEWESAFAGMVAIPRAHQNYSITIQKLLASFYTDADFQKAIK